MQKLLITGASGFLGWHLCQVAAADWEVYGTCLSRSIQVPGTKTLPVDLSNFQDLKTLFQTVQPDAVIHLAAQANLNRCQEQPKASHLINVTVSSHIAGLCADYGIPCAFSSTDQVFDGLHPPYRETDSVSPINRYGEQKALAENEMQSRYPQTAICRMPLMFGAVPPTASSFLQPFIQTLKEGRELNLFVDEIRTPVSGTTAATGLLLALQQVQGLIHLGGKEPISRYDFGRLMVEVLELPAAGLKACRQQDVKMAAPRPPDVSLDSSKAFDLGYAPPSLREELERVRERMREEG
ncbi:NAD(P)-dependent oxidoreductase [Kovacikia minuta CCNUW1]|uniref:SDR family oxidoreductase n=1 Tax=Kovacikia minuta TaxID=2931930 RepID=UPI001CCA9618|nr:NAD(P)-dependent oxidoreductase [Kovacikia minuta]UBF25666.1 NAD(P)-dependent oxidoreductase [Kovacikia minuta CCNUW1]